MRATRSSMFVQAIALALLGFKHEWAAFVIPLAALHLAFHWMASPRLVRDYSVPDARQDMVGFANALRAFEGLEEI